MLRHDFVEQIIRQIAAVLRKAMDSRAKGEPTEALSTVQQGYAVLGLDVGLVSALDARTIESLLRGPEELPMVARLRCFEAEQRRLMGDASAPRVGAQALALFAAAAEAGKLDGAGLTEARALREWVGDQHLEGALREALGRALGGDEGDGEMRG